MYLLFSQFYFSLSDPWIKGDKYKTSFRTNVFLSRDYPQEFKSEISCMIEKQEKWKNLSRELFKSLPKDFVSEFFSELPIIIDSGNSKAMKLSCDLCSMAFDNHVLLLDVCPFQAMWHNKTLCTLYKNSCRPCTFAHPNFYPTRTFLV